MFYEEMGFSRQMVEIVLNKYAEEAGGFDELQRKIAGSSQTGMIKVRKCEK